MEVMSITNLSATTYQISNALQYVSGTVAQQVVKTFQIFSWGVAPVRIAAGSSSAPQITTYTYYDPAPYSSGFSQPLRTISYPDGSWKWNANYDANGNPIDVYTSYGDILLSYATNNSGGGAQHTVYTYDPEAAGVSASGDDGTLNSIIPRLVIRSYGSTEVSRQYTVFPSAGVRLDVQCTVPGANWNDASNLTTTNTFYTNETNQYAMQTVLRPDGTMTAYNYITNASYQTNITVTGQPDASHSFIVDGVSNVTVLNASGYPVSAASYDVLSGNVLSANSYSNYDSYARPQQVTHLDGTTEYTQYSCCGLSSTTDRDNLTKAYLYDTDQRPLGYAAYYQGTSQNPIQYQNVLDAAGRTVGSLRNGSDGSWITLSQSAYDLAGELTLKTNALNGVSIYTRTNDSTTGGLIRTAINPDFGVISNVYYADGSLKKTLGTGTHGARYTYGFGTDVIGNTCTYTVERKLNPDGSDTSETTTTFIDAAGRTTEILYADGHYSRSYYNSQGQLAKRIDADGATTLYQYNAKGELAYTAVDLNQNGTIDFSGPDRITQTTNDVIFDFNYGTTVRRSRNFVWLDGLTSGTLVSVTETSANGLDTWQSRSGNSGTAVTTHRHTVPGTARIVTTTAPDNSYQISTNLYGRLVGSTRFDSGRNMIGGTTNGYDAHGRQNQVADARNGLTTLGFNNADLVATNTTPNPGGGSPEVTTTLYDNMLRPYCVISQTIPPSAVFIYSPANWGCNPARAPIRLVTVTITPGG